MVDTTNGSLPMAREVPTDGFLGVFVVGFIVVLTIALLAQALMLPWRRWFPGAEGEKSLFGGVKAAVYTFMSHLT